MSKAAWFCFFLLTLAGAARIVASYSHNSVTADERSHVSAGMEWWMQGTYMYEPHHPPLARIAVALGPFLAGYANFTPTGFWEDGAKVIFGQGDSKRVLTLARLGTLPFFVAGCLVVFLWTRELIGPAAAVLATLVYSMLPPVLAHGGLATTDMATGSLVPAALYLFLRALDSPSMLRWAAFGAALGLALLTKFTALLYLGVCLPAAAAVVLFPNYRKGLALWKQLLVSGLIAFLVVWAGFRFSFAPLSRDPSRQYAAVNRIVGSRGALHDLAYLCARTPAPAPEFVTGIRDVLSHARSGHKAYLLGETSSRGWWYFFPVAIAVKTPLPTLILFLIGAAVAILRRQLLLPLAFAALTVLAAMPGSINIGVRHVLPFYLYASIMAAFGGKWLWEITKWRLGTITLAVLLIWHTATSLAAHPYPLTYFNELSRLTDDPILVDSDRDWGQAVYLLQNYAVQRGIEEMHIALLGFKGADSRFYHPPAFHMLEPHKPRRGWLAVSMQRYYVMSGYEWLRDFRPVDVVGKSIYVFHLEDR